MRRRRETGEVMGHTIYTGRKGTNWSDEEGQKRKKEHTEEGSGQGENKNNIQ